MDKKCAIYHKLGVVPGVLSNTEGLSWHTVDLRKLFTILFCFFLLVARRNKTRIMAYTYDTLAHNTLQDDGKENT